MEEGRVEQPLQDIQILDLSRVFAAPAGTMILGDLGAEVIRVEHPDNTDSMRECAPFYEGESTYYISANRNKKSITINLKEQKGKEVFLNLVRDADVVVENFKTNTMKRLGLGYDNLKEVNEKIIMCSVTGFGQTGPLNESPGFDPVIQALSGLMSVTGQSDGEPTKVGVPIADILTSHYVAISILAAIRARDFNKEGQHIDLSLLDTQLSSLANVSSSYLNTGEEPLRVGNSHNNVVPYQVFQCKDYPIMLSVGNNKLFEKFSYLLNHSEWIEDERYCTNTQRLKNEKELVSKIQEILKEKNADEWIQLFSNAKIPAGKVNTIEQAFQQKQVKARRLVETLKHPKIGEIKMTKSPLRFSNLNVQTKTPPPMLGEHTQELLMENLGLTMKEIEQMKKSGI